MDTVPAMKVTSLDHVVLTCADVERSVAWWCDGLGLEPVRLVEWRRGEVPFVSVRIDDTTIIDLFAGDRTGQNMNHLAVVVTDVDLDELAASGRFGDVEPPATLFGARGIGRGIYVRDPDGNTVELRTYDATA
jgi:catechol 2,3-dioxygenase-like lactoylglutathione lyase family enzyme